ncbi:MAG: hypothetical protein ACLTJ5_05135 [Clostridium sp.]
MRTAGVCRGLTGPEGKIGPEGPQELKVCKVKREFRECVDHRGTQGAAWSKEQGVKETKEILEKPGYKDCRGYPEKPDHKVYKDREVQLSEIGPEGPQGIQGPKEIKEIKAREVTVV